MSRDPDQRKAFTISIVLHGLVLLGLFVSVAWNYATREPPPQHYFQLTEPVADAPLQDALSAPSQPPPQPQVQPLDVPKLPDLKPVQQPKPEPPKPEVVKTPPKPTPKPEVAKPKPAEPPPLSYKDFLKENKLPKQAAAAPPKPQTVAAPTIDVSEITRDLQRNLSTADNARINQMSSAQKQDYYDYYKHLRAIIDATFRPPAGVQEGLTVEIQFRVEGNGRISSYSVSRGSGTPELDQAALDTFRRIGSFPPPPDRKALSLKQQFTLRRQ